MNYGMGVQETNPSAGGQRDPRRFTLRVTQRAPARPRGAVNELSRLRRRAVTAATQSCKGEVAPRTREESEGDAAVAFPWGVGEGIKALDGVASTSTGLPCRERGRGRPAALPLSFPGRPRELGAR
jgi:hypothetical protein